MALNNSCRFPFSSILSKYLNGDYFEFSESFTKHEYLLCQLSSISEIVLQAELDSFRRCGGNDYENFVEKIQATIHADYPVLSNSLSRVAKSHNQYLSSIDDRLKCDWKNIAVSLGINIETNPDAKIDFNLGDNHNGEAVGLLSFSNGSKIIYKPRSSSVSIAYNNFIKWVSYKLDVDLKIFKVLDCGKYSWLEYVNYETSTTEDDMAEYYYKAGILLACTLLLGSKDCHQENVIASGKNPVIIDHETIIQPYFSNSYSYSWDNLHNIPPFSVLESSLIINSNTGAPKNCVGFGINNYFKFIDLEAQIVGANTIDSRRVPRFVDRNIVEKNVPQSEGKYVFVNQHKDNFVEGFTRAYDVFLDSKAELLSNDSPIHLFKDKIVRYVWRPTFVYYKILKYLRHPAFMACPKAYQSKLYELLSKAYKSEIMKPYKFVLDHEMRQMINGDIPIFHLNSQDNFLEGNKDVRIFKYNCIENINYRINLLSAEHKVEQLQYIAQWSNM